jgi:hypothetical protein
LTHFGVILHEFCHLLQYKVYPNIIESFLKEFPTERFYLNNYCNNEVVDELAEIMTLYLTNPYLLKRISRKHWLFCQKFFKSPIACSAQKCYNVYEMFPIMVKEHMKKHWKLTYDYNKQTFINL